MGAPDAVRSLTYMFVLGTLLGMRVHRAIVTLGFDSFGPQTNLRFEKHPWPARIVFDLEIHPVYILLSSNARVEFGRWIFSTDARPQSAGRCGRRQYFEFPANRVPTSPPPLLRADQPTTTSVQAQIRFVRDNNFPTTPHGYALASRGYSIAALRSISPTLWSAVFLPECCGRTDVPRAHALPFP